MNSSIIIEYSWWFLLPITALSGALVYGQYFYKKPFKNDLSIGRILTLASLRALVYIGVLFLLLNPRIEYSQEQIEKPLLIWAQDNSESIQLGQDSIYYRSKYAQEVEALLEKLESKYQVQKLSFGQEIKKVESFNFTDQLSDYTSLFSYLKSDMNVDNQTQIVLAGDGLYNLGNDPRFSVQELKCPVHTLILGDQKNKKDVSIVSLRSNKLAFLKSNIPVRLALKADFCKGEKIKFQLKSGSDILFRDSLIVSTDQFFIEKDFFISPNKIGLQKYELQVLPLNDEVNLKNNSSQFIVDVLDRKQKIALCYDCYHPDIAALQSALEDKSNFSIRLIDVSKEALSFSDFNLLILYQLPSYKTNLNLFFSQLKKLRLPFMMILGGATEINHLNRLNLGLKLVHDNNLFQNSRIKIDTHFSLFEMDEAHKKLIEAFPPLLSPMGKFYFNQENITMATQVVKGISTETPLIVFSQAKEQKQCYILGEGIWRWKLYDYKLNNSHMSFNTLIRQIVQYLALKIKKNQLSIQFDKEYKETDVIRIEAQLYNKSYQNTNKPNIKFLLKHEDGNKYAYQFERIGNVYQLEIGGLSAGNYQFEAIAKAFDQELIEKGDFVVSSENLEAKCLKANSNLFKNLSELSGGIHINLSEISKLTEFLLTNNSVKPRISISSNFSSILNFIPILGVIILLLFSEWFLKKYWFGI